MSILLLDSEFTFSSSKGLSLWCLVDSFLFMLLLVLYHSSNQRFNGITRQVSIHRNHSDNVFPFEIC